MAANDYYEILSVSRDASDAELKTAHRKIVRANHPDTHPNDKKAEETLQNANEAYQVLSDASRRAAYDRYGHAAFRYGEIVQPATDPTSDVFWQAARRGSYGNSARSNTQQPPVRTERQEFDDNIRNFNEYTSTRADVAPHLQAAFEKHPDWLTTELRNRVIDLTYQSDNFAEKSLFATVLKDSEPAEKYLFSKRVRNFIEHASMRAEVAPHLQAAFEKHPEWLTTGLRERIIDLTYDSYNYAEKSLFATALKDSESAEKYLFSKRVRNFIEHASTRSEVAPHLQAAFEKHPEWLTTERRERIIDLTYDSYNYAEKSLFATALKDSESAEKYLFSKRVRNFIEHASTRSEVAPHLQAAFEKHPEWLTTERRERIIDLTYQSYDHAEKSLFATALKDSESAEKYLFLKRLRNFNEYASTRSETAPHLLAAFEKHPEWLTTERRERIIDLTYQSYDHAEKSLFATALKDSEPAEKYLFSKRVFNFIECGSTRAEVAPHLQAAFEKHPVWNTETVRTTINRVIGSNPTNPALRNLQQVVNGVSPSMGKGQSDTPPPPPPTTPVLTRRIGMGM